MVAAEAKDARWIRAEAMMEYFMVDELTTYRLYNPYEERKDEVLVLCFLEMYEAVGLREG